MTSEIERLLTSCDPQVLDLTRRACEVVLTVFPGAVVTVDDRNTRFGPTVGFGTTTGYKGLRFTVTPQRTHVTLGIAQGARVADPSGLMEGTGKVHRHVKLRKSEDLERPELRQIMAAALAIAR